MVETSHLGRHYQYLHFKAENAKDIYKVTRLMLTRQ